MQFEFSAGGVVYKKEGEDVFVLICQHASYHHWGFPKGHIGDKVPGESKEEAAQREVKEETGATGKILASLTPFSYWYTFNGEKRKKTVYYFLMEYVAGDITKHDTEMEDVAWVSEDNIAEKLTFDSEKDIWNEARGLIKNDTK